MKGILIIMALLSYTLLQAQPMPLANENNLNDLADKTFSYDIMPLEYEYINQRDVMWEKRIWREIPIQTRLNQHFRYAKRPLAQVILEMVTNGEIIAYTTADDEFKKELCVADLRSLLNTKETVTILDPETFEETIVEVENKFDYARITHFKIKETWYFDSKYSKLNVRILGIAPMLTEYDDAGNILFEAPLCWLYYPDLRQKLVQEKVFNAANDASTLTWTDVFDMRYFESIITKESNVFDRRIKDYKEGIDALIEGQKIHESIRNFESDLWEY